MSESIFTTRRETVALLAGAALAPIAFPEGPAHAFQTNDAAVTPRRDQKFDLGWRFFKGEGAFEAPAADDSAWRSVDLPHDWSIEDLGPPATPRLVGPFDASAENGTATGFTIGGEGWYRKRFDVGDLPVDARAELVFDGAFTKTDVWLNGQPIGHHAHGYSPFAFDLTPHLQRNAENVLAVRVRNLGKNSRWYSGSGIYRPVSLDIFAEPSRIARWGVSAWTRRITNDRAEIEITTTLAEVVSGLRLRTRLVDADGAVAGESESSARAETEQRLRVRNPRLWSPASPNLYTLETTLLRGETIVDQVSQQFGVRIVVFSPEEGMTINGEKTKLRGGCVHHDNGLLGAAAFADADERRILLHKARGFNAIRSSHNPSSKSFREHCDRHGMLLIEEAFDMWHRPKNPDDYSNDFPEHWRADLRAMVMSARNSPSVIMWSIGNEVPSRASREGMEYAWRLANEARTLDPSRPVTAAIHGFNGRTVVAGARTAPEGKADKADGASVIFLDVPGYNYRLHDFEPDHAAHPWRVAYGSETYAKEAYDYEALVRRAPHVLGEFVWTSMDYLGEAGIGASNLGRATNSASPTAGMMPSAWPWVVANCGDIDLIGGQKPQSHYRDVVWGVSDLEMAVQRPVPEGQVEYISFWGWSDELQSWSWPGSENHPLKVRVYTSGDRVVLKLNGAEVGAKELTDEDKMRAEFTVPYAAGVLEAIAFRGGSQIGHKTFETVGAPATLQIRSERAAAPAHRQNLSYFVIEVLDARGRLLPDAQLPISLSVTGAADLVAFGSANPHAVGSLQAATAQTFRGRALAILRSRGTAGHVSVEVRSAGLAAATAMVQLT